MDDKITKALADHKDAITQFDVGATIADDDVEKWNKVIATERELRAMLEKGD